MTEMFDNVVVGVDEHQGARDPIALAKNLAATYAHVTLAHIYPPASAQSWAGSGWATTARPRASTRSKSLASEHGATLSAFEAVSLRAYLFSGGPAPVVEAIEDMVQDARGRIAGLEGVEPHAASGNPAEELTFYSASLDLLVGGSRGYGPIGRLVHGSTPQRLALPAACADPGRSRGRANRRARTR